MCTEPTDSAIYKANRDLEPAERRFKVLGMRGEEMVNSLAVKSARSGSKPTFVEDHDLVFSMVANAQSKSHKLSSRILKGGAICLIVLLIYTH